MLKIIILYTFLLNPIYALSCEDWFAALKITSAANCESKCRTSRTDMATFMCTNQCDTLCKSLKKEVPKDSNFYGLTDDEISYCESNKIACAQAYKLSWVSEKACLSIYKRSDTNDESDACRHYVWSYLMSQNIGEIEALKILNAHENNPEQGLEEKTMDDFNNQLAIKDYKNNKNAEKSEDEILNFFKKNVKEKRLKVIKQKYSNSGGIP